MKSSTQDELHKRDFQFENTLRPSLLKDFIGQEKVKERLQVLIQAAKLRGNPLEHLLFSGPPGLGKTSLAHIIAHEMGASLKCTSGPVIEKAGDLAGLLTTLQEGDLLFIDEIHRLDKTIEEYLYPAMEDFRIDIIIDQGPNARSMRLNLPRFTLIGATTRSGMISAPLRSRFGMHNRLDYYTAEELTRVVLRSAQILGVSIEHEAAFEIARRSRGTPRIANNLLRWVRDFALVKNAGHVTVAIADAALQMMEIDQDGLDELDTRLLETLIFKYQGGPVGLQSLSVAVGEEAGTIEEVCEPYLILCGFVHRTPQGRIATERAFKKFGVTPPSRTGDFFS
ncbi:MAG: Holliday junction branch migration DNA helicase RuvB [Methylacidiphilales bacterium]|nr:Holliday junction branch migration DNA helicase RuvB [Candidatus Methylacidiphilales bacterium]MDW8349615.1 Holliday junction branch migration DNA helicase RuvB [Verrucomicrobiae bacterium]